MDKELKAVACPFCGDTPGDDAHTLTDGGFKYGAIQCGCGVIGPDVRTDYKDWPSWKDAATRQWNTRAKQPSQGGEAVSLELVENLKYGGMHIHKWENLAGLGAGTHKLYTHPAGQVADGVVVSRELLVKLLDEGKRAATWAAQEELRALLEVNP